MLRTQIRFNVPKLFLNLQNKVNAVNASNKENYQSAGAASAAGGSDKLAASFRSMLELAMENQGPEGTAQMLEQLARDLRAAPRPAGGITTPYVNTIPAEQAFRPLDQGHCPLVK